MFYIMLFFGPGFVRDDKIIIIIIIYVNYLC